MKKIFIFPLVLCSFLNLNAQNKITGKIIEAVSSKGIPYVTIQAVSIDKKYTTVASSDVLGSFVMNVKSTGKYKLIFDAMGYCTDSLIVDIKEPSTNLGQINLSEGQLLKEVTVAARKLIMKDEGDRLVYDVTNDPESRKLKMSDIIKKIPFMTLNPKNGKLNYMNEDITTILIDGKPNEMVNGKRTFPMRLIKGDVMSKIEIILPNTKNNPGDKFIVNIKLERNFPDGYAAEITFSGNTNNEYGNSIDLVTKLNKLYLSTIYQINYQNKPKTEIFTTKENITPSTEYFLQKNNSTFFGEKVTHNLGIGASYEISKNDNISFSMNTDKSTDNNFINTYTGNYDISNQVVNTQTSSTSGKHSSIPRINCNGAYFHSFRDKVIVITYTLNNQQDNINHDIIAHNEAITNIWEQVSSEKTTSVDQFLAIDFRRNLNKKSILSLSGRYTNRRYNNKTNQQFWDYENQNIENPTVANKGLKYTQQIFSTYGAYRYTGKRFLLSVSMGAEQMLNNGEYKNVTTSEISHNELNLFPKINILYKANPGFKISLLYEIRTMRPNMDYLNPFEDNSDPNNISKGNPELKAEYAQRLTLLLSKIFSNNFLVTLTSSYENINNAIEKITIVENNGISLTTYANLSKKETYNLSSNINLRPVKWITINSNFSYIIASYQNKFTGIENRVSGINLSSRAEVKFGKTSSFAGNFSIFPQISSPQTHIVKYTNLVNFNFSQIIIKDKLFLFFTLDEPFNKRKFINNIIGNDTFIMTTSRQKIGRILGFKLAWNFGRLKEKLPGTNNSKSPDLFRPE